jgi:hypothetical protein
MDLIEDVNIPDGKNILKLSLEYFPGTGKRKS